MGRLSTIEKFLVIIFLTIKIKVVKKLTIQQLNDLYVCVGNRIHSIFEKYNELTIENAPKHLVEEAERLYELSDLIFSELKTR